MYLYRKICFCVIKESKAKSYFLGCFYHPLFLYQNMLPSFSQRTSTKTSFAFFINRRIFTKFSFIYLFIVIFLFIRVCWYGKRWVKKAPSWLISYMLFGNGHEHMLSFCSRMPEISLSVPLWLTALYKSYNTNFMTKDTRSITFCKRLTSELALYPKRYIPFAWPLYQLSNILVSH